MFSLKTPTGEWGDDKRDVRSWKGALGRKDVGRLAARSASWICIPTLVVAVYDARVVICATNEAGLHARMLGKGNCQGAKGMQVHHCPCLTQTMGQRSKMEVVAKGSVKEGVYSLRRCWGRSRQSAGLSGPVRQDLGKYAERGCSKKAMFLRESVDGALHLETKTGRFQTSHRTDGGRVN